MSKSFYLKQKIFIVFFAINALNKKILFLDLDNTLFNTGDLQSKGIRMDSSYQYAQPIMRMVNYSKNFSKGFDEVFILTARSFQYKKLTSEQTMLLSFEYKIPIKYFLLSKDMNNKYNIIKFYSLFAKKIHLIDDLTHGHEKQKVIWNQDLYFKISSLPNVKVSSLNNLNLFNGLN